MKQFNCESNENVFMFVNVYEFEWIDENWFKKLIKQMLIVINLNLIIIVIKYQLWI